MSEWPLGRGKNNNLLNKLMERERERISSWLLLHEIIENYTRAAGGGGGGWRLENGMEGGGINESLGEGDVSPSSRSPNSYNIQTGGAKLIRRERPRA